MSDINEIKRIVNESRVNGVYNWNLETIASLITTIESQKEEIKSYKAITELAVKGLERISVTFERGEMVRLAYEHLHKIKELQNGTT